jgi:bromodomain-containing protein 9
VLICLPCTALRKDTYGVFSEPVDPEEVSHGAVVLLCFQMGARMLTPAFYLWLQLPDYHEIIEHPMDFSTIREKLLNDSYSNLEQFEVSV